MRLEHKVSLVTGGGRGIGKAICELFAEEGSKVVVNDLVPDFGIKTVESIKRTGGNAIFVQGDVSKIADGERMVLTAVNQYGRLDILVNNAGIGVLGSIDNTPEERWNKVINTNLKGIYNVSRPAIRQMRKQGGGVIVNVASGAGISAIKNQASYCASKGGCMALTRAMAIDYISENIRVNCVAPGFTLTPLIDELREGKADGADPQTDYKELVDRVSRRPPIGRAASPSEIATCVLFLASDDSAYVVGQSIVVDGGATISY